MKLLTIDQSSRCNGYAIFDDKDLIAYGKFELNDEDLGKRLVQYRKKVEELIEKYDIEEVAFEDIQMQSQINNVQTFKVLAEIFGVTQEYLAEQGHSYQVVSSNTWKSQLNIKGKKRDEQKRNAQAYVLENYGIKTTQDEADAICIGACVTKNRKKPDLNWN